MICVCSLTPVGCRGNKHVEMTDYVLISDLESDVLTVQ